MTQDEIQAVARAICASIGSLESDETDAVWPDWIGEAKAAIAALDAARGKAEPVAWMYERGEERSAGYRKLKNDILRQEDGWTETPLYAHPPALDAARGDPVAQVVEWLRRENGLCDCHARCETECGCGAWDDWKTKPLLQIADAIERGEPFNG